MTVPAVDRLNRGTAVITELMRTRWVPLDQTRWDAALAACDLQSWRRSVRFHGVAGLLFHHHADQLVELLPADFLAVLKQQHDHFRMKALGQAGSLKQILQELKAADIPVMPLKGVTLSAQLYGDFAVRLAGDLDALVDERQLDQALSILIQNGWRREPDYDLSDPVLRRRALGYLRHVRLIDQGSRILELHWRTAATQQRSLPPLGEVGLRDHIVECHGLAFPVLPPDLQLMLIAHHSASAMVGRFKWGFDVIDLLASSQTTGPISPAMARSISAVISIMATQLRLEPGLLVSPSIATPHPLTDRLARSAHRWERERLFTRGMKSDKGMMESIQGRILRTAYYACLHGWRDWPAYIGTEIGRWLFTDAPAGMPVKSVWQSVSGRVPRLRG